ncbi:hypothetical protein [Jatrophihabitans sp.]|uniref:hypothetical protein n=1 Tax=Jatrophihabitans sp. TaxID=1932789 RepID=UPI002C8CD3A6|nr:hypothetical protein [Jatrophihabitans sp.]
MSMLGKIRDRYRKSVAIRSALIGAGSLLDLRGEASYQRLHAEMQANRRRTSPKESFIKAMQNRPR